MRLLVLAAGLCIAIVVSGGKVIAQGSQISVTPAIAEIPAWPGDVLTRKLRVTNGAAAGTPLSITTTSAIIDGEPLSGRDEDGRYDVSNWLDFSEDTYVFEPGQTRELSFAVIVPKDATPGGHYATILIRALALEQSPNSARSLVFPEVSVPVLITVAGEVKESAQIDKQNIFPLFMHDGPSSDIAFSVSNTGTTHNIVAPLIVLSDGEKIVSRARVEPSIVLPQTRKIYTATWEAPKEPGVYKAYVTFSFGSEKKPVESTPEYIVVGPTVRSIAATGIFTFVALHVFRNRRNLVAALKVLTAPQ